jgi:long-subunit fatty acid transport protein
MLDDISSEFDPITDADSNYGRVIGIKVASRTNPAIAEDMDVSGERKARVQVRHRDPSAFSANSNLRAICVSGGTAGQNPPTQDRTAKERVPNFFFVISVGESVWHFCEDHAFLQVG